MEQHRAQGSGAVISPARPGRRNPAGALWLSLAGAAGLILAAWWQVLTEQGAGAGGLLPGEWWAGGRVFLHQLLTGGPGRPAFLDPAGWRWAASLAAETLVMSLLATGLAALGALLTVIPAARTVADGTLTLRASSRGWAAYTVVRAAYALSRAVPELLWAMLVVFVLRPGMVAGALALALHNAGILGKLWAEVVEDLDPRPARALRASGASPGQLALYAVLPAVLPQFLTYLLYRWEVIIRTTVVVGFVNAGGLGRQFRLSMSWFHYDEVALLLAVYVLLVWLVDLTSAALRRLAR